MLAAAAGATGGTNPDAVVGAAQSAASPDEAVTNAQAIANFSNYAKVKTYLQGQSNAQQAQMWDQYSAKEQEGIRAAGYTPPGQGGGILGTLGRAAGAIAPDVGRAIGDVVNVLGSGLRAEQHIERTFIETAQNPTTFFSAKDWAQDWDETTTGNQYIDPGFKQHALAQYGQQTYNLAYKLATGQTPQQILAAVPAAQQQSIGLALQSQDVADAAHYLSDGHLSLGRQMAGALLGGYSLKPSATFDWISGGIDGLLDWFGDPYVIGAKVGEALLAARYMVQAVEDVDRLYETSASVRRASADLADHISNVVNLGRGTDELISRFPRLEQSGAIQQLIAAQADTTEKVRKFWASEAGIEALLSGRPAHAGEAAVLPHLSYAGVLRLGAKGALSRAFGFTADHTASLAVDPIDVAPDPLNPTPTTVINAGRGRFVTRLIRLVPENRTFKATDPNALGIMRDILATMHDPRDADRILTAFATNPDLGARRAIWTSMVQDMGKMAGLDADPERWDRYIGEYASTTGRKYAPGDLDVDFNAQGVREHVGIFKAHLNDNWLIPSFKDLYVEANKSRTLNALFRASNWDMLDRFMSYWRPLTLARLGFASRVSGEEALGFILREGPLNYLRAVGANLAYKAGRARLAAEGAQVFKAGELEKGIAAGLSPEELWAKGAKAVVADDHGRLFNMLARGLSKGTVDGATSIADLWAHSFANAVARTMETVGVAFQPAEYKAFIDEMVRRGGLEKGSYFWDHLTAMHGYDPATNAESFQDVVKDRGSGKEKFIEINLGRGYRGYNVTGSKLDENLYRIVYQRVLNQIASDDWAREALVQRSREDTVNVLTQKLLDDPDWKESRWSFVANGKYVGDGADQVSAREAAGVHANRIYDAVQRLTRSPKDWKLLKVDTADGEEALARYMLRTGKAPPWWASRELREAGEPAQLSSLAFEDMPKDVNGPEMVMAVNEKNIRRLTNWMFRKYIGPQINFISRQPMFIHNAVESMKAYEGMADHWRSLGMDEEQVQDLLFHHAQERAFNATIPYVHNPELRSQMSTVTRNLAPFWFAQEQFYKRWARTFTFSPWAFRQLQLISGGLSHMGFIHTDPENGQEYFVYPASAAAVDVLSHVLSAFGVKDEVPVEADLTGYVSMLNPGIQRGFLPNFGPVVSVGMDGLRSLDTHTFNALGGPTVNKLLDWAQGTQAEDQGYLASVLPTTVLRIIDAADPGQFDQSQYASAVMSAIQYLEATGHGLGYPALRQVGTGPPPKSGHFVPGDYVDNDGSYDVYQPDGHWADNSVQAQTAYLQRVQNWARVFFSVRALYGFGGPASPENYFDPNGMSAELQTLMNEMPYNQAVATFMTLHPDATAMTVFQTQNTLGGFLPATNSALQFIQANPQMFMGDNSAGAIYFLPQPDTSGNFSLPAYEQELSQGLRVQKAPADYWTEIAYQEAANDYYAVANYKDGLIATHSASSRAIDEEWTRFSAQFMLANPLFRQMYSDTGAVTREAIMTQVGNILANPTTPQSPQTYAIAQLYNQYVAWQSLAGNYGQPNAPSSSEAYRYNEQFAYWVSNFVKENPGVQPLVQRVIEPMLETTLTDMAANGVVISL
jgi:hypothetical protein